MHIIKIQKQCSHKVERDHNYYHDSIKYKTLRKEENKNKIKLVKIS